MPAAVVPHDADTCNFYCFKWPSKPGRNTPPEHPAWSCMRSDAAVGLPSSPAPLRWCQQTPPAQFLGCCCQSGGIPSAQPPACSLYRTSKSGFLLFPSLSSSRVILSPHPAWLGPWPCMSVTHGLCPQSQPELVQPSPLCPLDLHLSEMTLSFTHSHGLTPPTRVTHASEPPDLRLGIVTSLA